MARIKRYRPGKSKKAPRIPTAPAMPKPSQAKLDGFTTPELEALEGEIELFAAVQDRVKEAKKKLQEELDTQEAKLIEAMKKANLEAVVIGGYIVAIATTTKAKVKGAPKKKKDEEPETKVEITHRGRTVQTTAEDIQKVAEQVAAE